MTRGVLRRLFSTLPPRILLRKGTIEDAHAIRSLILNACEPSHYAPLERFYTITYLQHGIYNGDSHIIAELESNTVWQYASQFELPFLNKLKNK